MPDYFTKPPKFCEKCKTELVFTYDRFGIGTASCKCACTCGKCEKDSSEVRDN